MPISTSSSGSPSSAWTSRWSPASCRSPTTKLARFSDACGAELPRWIRKQLEAYGDDSRSIQAFGEQVISEMCERLLEGGAPGLHFYTLNQADPSLAIWKNLQLPR